MDGAENNVSRVRLKYTFQVYAVYADDADAAVQFVCFDREHAQRLGSRWFNVPADEIECRYLKTLILEDAY